MEPTLDLERPQIPEKALVMGKKAWILYLSRLESQGKTKLTIKTYRRCLERLFVFPPDNKVAAANSHLVSGVCGMQEISDKADAA